MKISKERLAQIIQEELSIGIGMADEEIDGEHPVDPHGYEGRMVKQNLWKMAEYAKEMYELIADDEDLEPWVEEKIAIAAFMMDSVGHYMQYEKHRSHEDMEGEEDHFEMPHDEDDEDEHGDFDEPDDEGGDDEEYEFIPDDEDSDDEDYDDMDDDSDEEV